MRKPAGIEVSRTIRRVNAIARVIDGNNREEEEEECIAFNEVMDIQTLKKREGFFCHKTDG